MIKVVEATTEEINRIFSSISQINSYGCVQALTDLNQVQISLKPYMSSVSKQFLEEAKKAILVLQESKNQQ